MLPKPDKCFEEGMQYVQDILETEKSGTKKFDERECQIQCKKTKECKFWTFDGGRKRCFLLTSKKKTRPEGLYISGEKDCEPTGRQFQIRLR